MEWWIYFLFPLLVLGWRRIGGGQTTAVLVLAGLLMAHLTPYRLLFGLSPQYVGLFAMGTCAAAVSYPGESRWSGWQRRVPWGIILAITFLLVAAVIHPPHFGSLRHFALSTVKLDTIFGLWVALLLIATAQPKLLLTRLLSWRPLVSVGTFAYSLYLIHAPLLQIVWQYGLHPLHLGPRATFALLALAGTPLIVGTSYLFFLAFEKPFLTMRKHETAAEVARDAALSPAP